MNAFPRRYLLTVSGIALALFAIAGCARRDEAASPEIALGDQPGALMPPARPAIDLSLLTDQSSVTLVKKVEIKYGPLKAADEPADEQPAADEGAPRKTSKTAKKPATDDDADIDAAPRKRTKIGSALSQVVGMLPGGRKKPPPAPTDEEEPDAAPARPRPAAVKLVDARGSPADIPASPTELPAEKLNAVREAARADAVKNLMKVAYSLPLDPTQTVGDAIGQSADKFPNEPEGVNVFDARWVDESTLEVDVEITVGQLVASLATTFEDVDFKPLEALDAAKAITAKGRGKVPGAKPADEDGKKPPPKRPRTAGGGKPT